MQPKPHSLSGQESSVEMIEGSGPEAERAASEIQLLIRTSENLLCF